MGIGVVVDLCHQLPPPPLPTCKRLSLQEQEVSLCLAFANQFSAGEGVYLLYNCVAVLDR